MTALSKNARVAGLLYIGFSLVGVVRLLYIPSVLMVHGNAVETANNIAAHEGSFRLGIVTQLVMAAGWIFVTLALYRLFKGVDRKLAVLMVILGSLMPVPIFFCNAVNDVAALLFARGEDFLTAFDKPQRDALVMLFLDLHHHGDLVNIVFWGLWLFPLGLLVSRSGFLPRFLGWWLIAGCFGYLAISVAGLLFPLHAAKVYSYAQPLITGEVAFMLWLAIMGVKEQRVAASS
jgi:hypothetical protein